MVSNFSSSFSSRSTEVNKTILQNICDLWVVYCKMCLCEEEEVNILKVLCNFFGVMFTKVSLIPSCLTALVTQEYNEQIQISFLHLQKTYAFCLHEQRRIIKCLICFTTFDTHVVITYNMFLIESWLTNC